MNTFLWGAAFQGLVDDFGRPRMRHLTGLAYEEGAASGAAARLAVRRRQAIPEGVRLSEVAEEAVREAGQLAALDGAVCAAVVVDPRDWPHLLGGAADRGQCQVGLALEVVVHPPGRLHGGGA